MPASWMDELNEPQRAAVTHPGGPVLVIAGAGSGKTKTLACRVAWLVERGVSPERILLLTFTRRSAAEMIGRAGRIAGQGDSLRVWGGTFHAVAHRLLRLYGRALGLPPEFTVIDPGDAADLMNLIRSDLGLGEGKRRFPQKQTLVGIYSRMVNSRTRLSELLQRHYPWVREESEGLRQIFEAYTIRKRRQNVLDYDDLLLFWHALCTAPGVGAEIAGRFDHVLVDEYQDTNPIQSEILRALCPHPEGEWGKRSAMAVGDDAQSIYSFRAATVRNILDFPTHFPGTALIKLEQNYRSTPQILEASNEVMRHAAERFTKNLYTRRADGEKPQLITCQDEGEQCLAVCERVLEHREEGVKLRDQAVLFRAGHHSDQLEVELARRNIPFVKYGGLKFVEAAHVKDLVALLRVLENPADELGWFRVLQLLEGIGPASARKIIAAVTAEAEDGRGPLRKLIESPPEVPSPARAEFNSLRAAVADCVGLRLPEQEEEGANPSTGEEPPVSAQVERLRRFYEPLFQRRYDNPQLRLRDLDQLEQVASRAPSRAQFLADLTLDPPNSTQDLAGSPTLDEDYLILSTIHSAKGGEWDVVHLLHVADGVIPSELSTGSPEEVDEERRLLYVAMTRARDRLHLYLPLRYYDRPRGRSDRHSYNQLTRFITQTAFPLYERTAFPAEAPTDEAVPDVTPAAVGKIDALLGSLWNE